MQNPPAGRTPRPAHTRRRGLTLVEIVVSVPLVALVLVAAMASTGGTLRTWNQSQEQHLGLALAEQLLSEAMRQSFDDPDGTTTWGVEASENASMRSGWDDVDDYDGWTASPPVEIDGTPLTGVNGWTRSSSVTFVQLANPTQMTGSDEGLKRITVTVSRPAGGVTVLTAYRSRWGALEASPLLDATPQVYATHEMEIAGRSLHGGVSLPNHAEDQ